MPNAPIYLRAKRVVFLGDGSATATGAVRDGVPEVLHGVREIEARAIYLAPSVAEAARHIAKGRAVPFEAGGKLDLLLPAVLDLETRAEAAEAASNIRGVRVWRAVRGPDGHWRPAPSELGGVGPTTDASFRSVKAIRQWWAAHPKATPLFIVDQPEGMRAFAWVNGALVEALRN